MAKRLRVQTSFEGIDKISAPINRGANSVDKSTRRMNRAMDRTTGRMRGMGTVGGAALGIGGLAGSFLLLRRVMGDVITTGAALEQQLVGAGARFVDPIRKGTEAFKELEDAARLQGRTTEFTSIASAGALNFFAKAGLQADQALRLLPQTVDFATASETDLARAADIATDSLNAFGLASDDAGTLAANFGKLSDQMAKSVNISNVSLEEMFETVKLAAVVTQQAKLPVRDFMALTAQLADNSLKGSRAGTAIANAFQQMVQPKNLKALEKLMGSKLIDKGTGRMRDFADVMDDLSAGLGRKFGNRVDKRLAFLSQVFGLRGLKAIGIVLQDGTENFRQYRAQITDSVGAMRELAVTLRSTREGQIKEMNSAVEGLGLTFSAVFSEDIEQGITGLTRLTRAAEQFVAEEPELTKSLGNITAGTAAFLGLFGAGALGVAGLGKLGKIGAVGRAGPIGLAAAGGLTGFELGKFLGTIPKVAAVVDPIAEAFAGTESNLESFPEAAPPVQRFADLLRASKGLSPIAHELTVSNQTDLEMSLRQIGRPGSRRISPALHLLPSGEFREFVN